jgi:hypothetical protein
LKNNFNASDFALGDSNKVLLEREEYQINYSPYKMDDASIDFLLNDEKDTVVFIGNSQNFAINNFEKSDHLFSYYLYKDIKTKNIINISAPNANIQEHFEAVTYIERSLKGKVKYIFISLVFDDTREDGLRDSVLYLNNDKSTSDTNIKLNFNTKFEKIIVDTLGDKFNFFKNREIVRGLILSKLYHFRNYILNITPSTIRKKIPQRYDKNIEAFRKIIEFCENNDIVLIPYIAPLRNDIKIPYDFNEYTNFKADVIRLHEVYNLESEVSNIFWGTVNNNENIDFMHFQGKGHKQLAEKFYQILKNDYGIQ